MVRGVTNQIAASIRSKVSCETALGPGLVYAKGNIAFVVGLLVEGTPYKASYYIYDFLLPLYSCNEHLYLAYSYRLTKKGFRNERFEGNAEQVADEVSQILPVTRLARFGSAYGPADFLAAYGENTDQLWRPRTCFELAAAQGALGNLEAATSWLLRAAQAQQHLTAVRGASEADARTLAEIGMLRRAIEDGTVRETLEGACRSNAAKLGLDVNA